MTGWCVDLPSMFLTYTHGQFRFKLLPTEQPTFQFQSVQRTYCSALHRIRIFAMKFPIATLTSVGVQIEPVRFVCMKIRINQVSNHSFNSNTTRIWARIRFRLVHYLCYKAPGPSPICNNIILVSLESGDQWFLEFRALSYYNCFETHSLIWLGNHH